MLDPQDPDPRAIRFARPSTVPLELDIDACNFGRGLALLNNGTVVPIVLGLLLSGETCGVDDPELYCFVCGSNETGWQWRYRADFDHGHTNQ